MVCVRRTESFVAPNNGKKSAGECAWEAAKDKGVSIGLDILGAIPVFGNGVSAGAGIVRAGIAVNHAMDRNYFTDLCPVDATLSYRLAPNNTQAGGPYIKIHQNIGCPLHAVSSHEWAFAPRANRFLSVMDQVGFTGSSGQNKTPKNNRKTRCQAPNPFISLNTNHFTVVLMAPSILYT